MPGRFKDSYRKIVKTQIADMLNTGKDSKDISLMLNIDPRTVDKIVSELSKVPEDTFDKSQLEVELSEVRQRIKKELSKDNDNISHLLLSKLNERELGLVGLLQTQEGIDSYPKNWEEWQAQNPPRFSQDCYRCFSDLMLRDLPPDHCKIDISQPHWQKMLNPS